MADSDDPNAHVRSYLDYYIGASEPLGYAVLLNGPWGVGKTFLIKKYFEERSKNTLDYIYLSLFAAASGRDVQRALFAAAYPILAGKRADLVSSIAKSALGLFNFGTDIKLEDFAPIPKDKVIVVDDIERCAMPIQDALGHLNSLVEHDGHKLIILGHEDAVPIHQMGEYLRRREKLVGQVLTVRSDTKGACEYFLSKLQVGAAKSFLDRSFESILAVYEQSSVRNLRVLRQALRQFERIYSSIDEKYRKSEEVMRELLQLILALALEYNTGGLTADELRNRETGLLFAVRQINNERRDNSDEKDKFELVGAKYVGVDLRNEILSNQTLAQALVEGFIDVDGINNDISNSHQFIYLAPEEAWRTIWNGFSRPVEAFESAKDEMLRRFSAREYTDPGVIIHVAMLQFWLLELGYIQKTYDQLIQDVKDCIDDLLEAGAFNQQSSNVQYWQSPIESHGLGFFNKDKPEFDEITGYIREKLSVAREGMRSSWAAELLGRLSQDPSEFLQQVCFTNHGSNRFVHEPLLHMIDAEEFLDVVLKLDPSDQTTAFGALKARYDHNALEGELSVEKDWFNKLRSVLHSRAKESKGITRYRLDMFDKWYFSPSLGEQAQR